MRKTVGTRVSLRLVALALAFLAVSGAGCSWLQGLFGKGPQPSADRALSDLEAAIAMLGNQSADWQQTLRDLQNKLTNDAQSTLANEVTTLIQRTGETAGLQFRCEADFLRDRLTAALERIVARLKNQPVPPVVARACGSIPNSVTLPLEQSRQTTLDVFGYDLDTTGADAVSAWLKNEANQEVEVTSYIRGRMPYQLVLALGQMPLTTSYPASTSIELRQRTQSVGLVAVVVPNMPPSVAVTSATGRMESGSRADAPVPAGHILIGGGCVSNSTGKGKLLIASRPGDNKDSWKCGAHDHIEADQAAVTAYALSLPRTPSVDVNVSGPFWSDRSGHPESRMYLPAGYTVVGGGCEVQSDEPGQLLVDSYPITGGWVCVSKDHGAGHAAQGKVGAWVIGIRAGGAYDVVSGESAVVTGGSGQEAKAELADAMAAVVGGGCDVNYAGVGTLLNADYPDGRRWICRSHDHHNPDNTGSLKAYVFGLKKHR